MKLKCPTVWQRTSRYAEKIRPYVKDDGTLRNYSMGYPLYYLIHHSDRDYAIVCAKCASDAYKDYDGYYNIKVIDVDVNWEDNNLYCDCNERISSAYSD